MQIFITYDLTSHHWLYLCNNSRLARAHPAFPPQAAPAENHYTLKATPAGAPLWSIMTTDRIVLEINALSILHKIICLFSLSFPKDVRKSLNIFFTLTACDSNTSHFKSNNLVRNALKPWQLKLQKNEHKTVCNSNCRGFACAGKDKSPTDRFETSLLITGNRWYRIVHFGTISNLQGKLHMKFSFAKRWTAPKLWRHHSLFIFWDFLFPSSPAAVSFLNCWSYARTTWCQRLGQFWPTRQKSNPCSCEASQCSEMRQLSVQPSASSLGSRAS